MLYAELQKSHTLIVADKTLITASSVAEISPGSRTKATAEERATNRTTATQSGTYPHKKSISPNGSPVQNKAGANLALSPGAGK